MSSEIKCTLYNVHGSAGKYGGDERGRCYSAPLPHPFIFYSRVMNRFEDDGKFYPPYRIFPS
jgi:hypothetical protein